MDSLQGTSWDVLIAGTGLQESLLALALARTGKKVLHVDKNSYYGGAEAALSLHEAEEWCKSVNNTSKNHLAGVFSNAFTRSFDDTVNSDQPKLSFSRAYSLALAPQLIYTRSSLLPALVAAGVDAQIEFLAVGNWWIHSTPSFAGTIPLSIKRVPNGREDVVADPELDLRQKRALMKFLRFISTYEEQYESWAAYASKPLEEFLSNQFRLSLAVQQPLHATVLSPTPPSLATTAYSLPRIARHLRSIGLFGPGFGAVIPKWGGLAEIAQVGCRAGAVGGGVYVLGNGIKRITMLSKVSIPETNVEVTERLMSAHLATGDVVEVDWVIGAQDNIPLPLDRPAEESNNPTPPEHRSISIVSSPLHHLFSPIAEGAPPPAVAVVVFPPNTLLSDEQEQNTSPVYILVHSSSTGACPDGQSILYSSVEGGAKDGFTLLDSATALLLSSAEGACVLWKLCYKQGSGVGSFRAEPETGRVLVFAPMLLDRALDDAVLTRVREAWLKITGLEPEDFMAFGRLTEEAGRDFAADE